MTNENRFFIPHAKDADEAESVYQGFWKSSQMYDPVHPEARLCSIHFTHNGKSCEATVGKPINHFPESTGDVLAIIERSQLVFVYTVLRGVRPATPIYVSPEEARGRRYFDDFPPLP
jgi:hypothetical protein